MKSNIINIAISNGLQIIPPDQENNIAHILFRFESTEIYISTSTKDGSYIVTAKSFASILSGMIFSYS